MTMIFVAMEKGKRTMTRREQALDLMLMAPTIPEMKKFFNGDFLEKEFYKKLLQGGFSREDAGIILAAVTVGGMKLG